MPDGRSSKRAWYDKDKNGTDRYYKKRGGKRKFHIMSCVVFDDENVEISLSDKTAKYPAVLSGKYI